MKKITALKVLENYRVWLRFDDGAEGVVDFSPKRRTGVYGIWNNYENFRKARVGQGGELAWDDQVEFCADSLWLQVTGRTAEALLNQNSLHA